MEDEPIILFGSKATLTQKQQNLYKLEQELKKYPEIDDSRRAIIMSQAQNLPNIEYLSSRVLAGAYAIIYRLNNNLTPNTVYPQLDGIVSRFEIEQNVNDAKYLAYKDSIIRYLNLIVSNTNT